MSGPGVSKQGGWARTPWPQQRQVVSARPPTPAPACLQQCCVCRKEVHGFIENIFLLKNN